MSPLNKDTILACLSPVTDPFSGKPLPDSNLISGMIIEESRVTITLDVPHAQAMRYTTTQQEVQAALDSVAEITKATVVISTHSNAPQRSKNPKISPASPVQKAPSKGAARPAPITLDGIGAAVAVASGKGGVGKSTTAINLAIALSNMGLRVGLLDADVYGPSVPIMAGLAEKPTVGADSKLTPLLAHGVKCMSLGLLMDADAPAVWRGPMVVGALEQLVREVSWAPLDVLLLDLPPGTGDVQLSLVQKVPLSGAVIVSTPQAVALGDVRKGIKLFEKTHVPILGVIENMSTYICPKCGHEEHIFGTDGAHKMAQNLDLPFLGHIPLEVSIRESGDEGVPIVAKDSAAAVSLAYAQIAQSLAKSIQVGQRKAPIIRMED